MGTLPLQTGTFVKCVCVCHTHTGHVVRASRFELLLCVGAGTLVRVSRFEPSFCVYRSVRTPESEPSVK
jgi:hypothetical protein